MCDEDVDVFVVLGVEYMVLMWMVCVDVWMWVVEMCEVTRATAATLRDVAAAARDAECVWVVKCV